MQCFAVKLRRERASEKLENCENKELKDHSRIVVGIASLVYVVSSGNGGKNR